MLSKEIGIADTLRFLNQFSTGYGDYTKERGALLADLTLDEILSTIKRARRGHVPPKRKQPRREEHTRG